jgi:dihydrofolate reductase
MSLDAFIAGPNGEYDWIPSDETINFPAFLKKIDTVLIGRKTFEVAVREDPSAANPKMRTFVFSRTLKPADYPGVRIVTDNASFVVSSLRAETGKDIWLMGGGELFRTLLDARLVDTIEIGIVPILLGRGIRLLPEFLQSVPLKFRKSETFPSGIILMKYDVAYDSRIQ